MLSVYTRHYNPPCKRKNPAWRRCKCPKWIQGTTDAGEFIRRSAETRSWAKAQKLVRELEKEADAAPAAVAPPPPVLPSVEERKPAPGQKRIEIEEAVEMFLKDVATRGLKEPTQQKLRNLCCRQLLGWAKRESLIYLDALTTANLTSFRNEWRDAALARKKKHERMISFLRFCVGCGWLQKNPAAAMRRVKADPIPTDYFRQRRSRKFSMLQSCTGILTTKKCITMQRA